MLTIKILCTINSLEKKKKLFIENTIYNSCRFKKHLRGPAPKKRPMISG